MSFHCVGSRDWASAGRPPLSSLAQQLRKRTAEVTLTNLDLQSQTNGLAGDVNLLRAVLRFESQQPIVSWLIIFRVIIDLQRMSVCVCHSCRNCSPSVLCWFSSVDSLSEHQCVVVFHPSVRIFSSLTEKMSALLAAWRWKALLGCVKMLPLC